MPHPLSQKAQAILNRLRQSWQSPSHTRLTLEDEARHLTQLGEQHDPAAVPPLVTFLLSGPDLTALAAAAAIQEIIDAADPARLPRLDQLLRKSGEWRYTVFPATRVTSRSFGQPAALGVFSSYYDGRVREAAVRALTTIHDGRELPFLLIRANDWVSHVRFPAKDALLQRLRPDYAPHFVRWLPLVFRLPAQGREDHAHLFNAVTTLLRTDACRPAVRAGLASPHRSVRRLAFQLLSSAPPADLLPILTDALVSDDTVLRLRAAQQLLRQLDGQPLSDLLDHLRTDRYMPIRRAALYAYAERLPDLAPTRLRAALFDPHVSIRETARFFQRNQGTSDFAPIYRDHLTNPASADLPAAIAGLGETGTRDDAPRLTPFLNHPDPRVRRATLRAVARLDPDQLAAHLATALQDSSTTVARAARDIALARPYLVPPETLWSIFSTTDHQHSRRFALDLFGHLPGWAGLPSLIRAAATAPDPLRRRAADYLQTWSHNPHRYAARPTPDQLRQLQDAISSHPEALDPRIMTVLRQGLAWMRGDASR